MTLQHCQGHPGNADDHHFDNKLNLLSTTMSLLA
eukprot:CAMPEP_0185904840 /NCGR_PEP_ID=MMETSP0196C-20130402/4121_1 /TAXON_ID=2932 /ORGANISM="Alexandrium fundyense, Strain CCMP1719" /LENGTH=33 /DNA_ID= /DNA_START= /DNA_END= /DNA_ORIENTATION=